MRRRDLERKLRIAGCYLKEKAAHILYYDAKNDIAVNQYFHQSPRVMAIICSVLIPTVALPRILETMSLPRL